MNQFTTEPTSMSKGRRVLVGTRMSARRNGRNQWRNDPQWATVVSDEPRRLEVVDAAGEPRILQIVQDDFSRLRRDPIGNTLLWSVDLPLADDDAAMRFCQVALDADTEMGLFHVVAAAEGVVTVRLVVDRRIEPLEKWPIPEGVDTTNRLVEFVGEGEIAFSKDVYGLHVGDHPLRSGDLVAARSYVAWIEDGLPVWHPHDWVVVGNFGDSNAVAAFVPPRPPRSEGVFAHAGSRFGDESLYQHELDMAWASTEPDEALVLVTRTGNHDGVSILAQHGRTLFVWEDPATSLEGQAPGPGLWLIHDLDGWSYTSHEDYDCGIDADWRPASIEDLSRWGLSETEMDAQILENLDAEADPEGLTRSMIAQAESVPVERAPTA